jgi:uncharacterized membrane protein
MSLLDRVAAQFSKHDQRNAKIMFWLISPILVPTFAKIFSFPVHYLTKLLLLPFGSAGEGLPGLIIFIVGVIVCYVLAILSLVQLWRIFKKHCLQDSA